MKAYKSKNGVVAFYSPKLASLLKGAVEVEKVYMSLDGELHDTQVAGSTEVDHQTVLKFIPNGSIFVNQGDIPEGKMIDGKGGFKDVAKPVDPALQII